ncbi:ionotropic receptor 75a-like [Malaya genurostris]|uniref:ionotropic receptor 75a-like n=1 Tax=Malaya genurostris TaxID=325434 RepID=UPI0026F39A63|nr:ionotropic receptor 75a-like [Malaya genurostris]
MTDVHSIQVSEFGGDSFFRNVSVGVAGQLKEHNVELVEAIVAILPERIAYVDSSATVATFVIVFRHPVRIAGKNAFTQPFEANLWYTILATVAVASIVLGVAFRMESKHPGEYFLTIFGFICQQGYEDKTSKWTTKWIVLVMLLFSSLMYQFYGSSIIGSLLTPPPKNLKTLRQLIDSDLHVTMEDLFYNWDFFNTTKDPLATELFVKKILRFPDKHVDASRGVELVRKGGCAVLSDIGHSYMKMKVMKSLVVLLLLVHCTDAIMNVKLLDDYVRWQRLGIVVIFHCMNQNSEIFQISQQISLSFNVQLYYEDISNFSPSLWNHSHVMRFDYNKVGAVVDLDCAETSGVFESISRYEYFNGSYYWLMFENDSLESATCLLDEQNINIDAKITLAVSRDERSTAFDLYDVYSVIRDRGSPLNVTLMGSWSVEQGLDIAVHQSEYERRFDFRGMWLKAGVTVLNQVHNMTLVQHLSSEAKVDKYALHRYGYRMWELVMRKHNFTMHMVRMPSRGLLDTDGHSSQGVVGLLATRECDLIVNCLFYTKPRVGSFDYTVTVAVSRMLFVFRHPKKTQSHYGFLTPFRFDLWIGVLVLILFAAAILFGNFNAESYEQPSENLSRDNRSLSLLIIFGILNQQGFSSKTTYSSTRITLISMLTFSILIYQFYSTYIVGYLLIVPPKFMNSLKHLLNSDLKVLVENLDHNKLFLNTTKDPAIMELYNRKILNGENNFVNVSEGVARVKEGGYAFQCDPTYVYPLAKETFTDREICDLQEIHIHPSYPMHLPLRKGSPFKEMFRITLRKAVESAVTKYHQDRFFSSKPKCATNELQTTTVDLEQVSMLFVGLYIGILCCCGILLLEILNYIIMKKIQQNN